MNVVTKKKCFNCQEFNHIAADSKEQKRTTLQGRDYKNISRGRGSGRGYGRTEVTLKTKDEAVLQISNR